MNPVLDSKGNTFLDSGETRALLTPSGLKVSNGYNRVVRGDRGNYIEITPEQFIEHTSSIPPDQKWRILHDKCYYIERRTRDASFVKIYVQKKTVDYADYKPGLIYIAPTDLVIDV